MTQFSIAWRAAVGALGLGLALGACANDSTAVVDPERTHKVEVSSQYVSTPIMLGRNNALEPSESAKLAATVGAFMSAGGGTLEIVVPQGAGAAAKAKVVRDFALAAGARGAEVDVRFADVAVSEPIVVSYERFVATAPDCNPTRQNAGFNPQNLRQDSYGCAVQHNLAVMVANPADLVHMQRETPADATLRTKGVVDYRAGESPSSDDSTEPGSAASF
jgi:pilus assembly protein CpaD